MTVNGALPEINELSSTADPKIRTLLAELKAEVNTQVERQLAAKWYEPKIIPAEQSTSSTTYTTLTTADEVTGVVVPAGGVIRVGYAAIWKSSVAEAGKAGLFVGANQVANASTGETEARTLGAGITGTLMTGKAPAPQGFPLISGGGLAAFSAAEAIQWAEIFPSTAGTYVVSVKFKASSGSVTAKERRLWVEVHPGS